MTAALGDYFGGCTLNTRDRMQHTFLVMGHVCHMRSQAGNTTATFATHGLPIMAAGLELRVGDGMGHRHSQMGHCQL